MSADEPVVAALSITAVKGLQIEPREELFLDRSGVHENRRFFLVDEGLRMVNGKQIGELTMVRSRYDEGTHELALDFPNGERVTGPAALGEPVTVAFFSRTRVARTVLGPFSPALSAHAGQRLTLVEADRADGGVDRGAIGAATLISRGSLTKLAEIADREAIDARRFRMLIEIDGIPAHTEDEWVGHRARIGESEVAFEGHVGRCLVTSRDPESGEIDLPTLDLLRGYRDDSATTEPLPFGIYGRVLEPGRIRVGDPVTLDRR